MVAHTFGMGVCCSSEKLAIDFRSNGRFGRSAYCCVCEVAIKCAWSNWVPKLTAGPRWAVVTLVSELLLFARASVAIGVATVEISSFIALIFPSISFAIRANRGSLETRREQQLSQVRLVSRLSDP